MHNRDMPLLERLRHFGANGMGDVGACCRDAADEIERLRGALSRLKQAFDDRRISGSVYYEDTGFRSNRIAPPCTFIAIS